MNAAEQVEQVAAQERRAVERELEDAEYEASLASRRYELVDPAKRHVARELEARWNTALEQVERTRQRLDGLDAERASLPRSWYIFTHRYNFAPPLTHRRGVAIAML